MPVTALPSRTEKGEPLLTLEEAAGVLGISRGTLKHWVAWKRIEHVKIGKFTRFRRAALDRFINGHTVPAQAEE